MRDCLRRCGTGSRWFLGGVAGAALAVGGMSGCGAETIAFAGVFGEAAESGGGLLSSGKAIAAVKASFEDTCAAAERAASEFGYEIEVDRLSGSGYRRFYRLMDDRGGRISIRIDHRAPTLTQIEVNCGLLGHQPSARLVITEILIELGLDSDHD